MENMYFTVIMFEISGIRKPSPAPYEIGTLFFFFLIRFQTVGKLFGIYVTDQFSVFLI